MKRFIFDTCFWFALFDSRDHFHEQATSIFKTMEHNEIKILIPFPSLYETLNTEFVKCKEQLHRLDQIVQRREKVFLIEDSNYKDLAYDCTINQKEGMKVSLVDNIIMAMASDSKLHIDGIISFNERDFVPFCQERGITLISYSSMVECL